ncbi:putative T7SS-secreted protein [Streptomyces sp. NPDC049949]|uniref:putative T7SS-secreted protein n=1 Tax=Streptomyces sp. NPDC049949 TaxID=3154627 RepID=UPI0034322A5B
MSDWAVSWTAGLQKLDVGWEVTQKAVGQGVDKATDGIGAGLEYLGADDWADKVEDWATTSLPISLLRSANRGWGKVSERVGARQAGGDRESAKHLKGFQGRSTGLAKACGRWTPATPRCSPRRCATCRPRRSTRRWTSGSR